MTERAEQDSAVGVRALGEARAGSAIRDRAKGTVPWGKSRQCHRDKARQCHQDQCYGDSAGQCHQGQCYGDSAMEIAQSIAIRLHAVGTAQAVPLPCVAQQDPPPGVISPVPTLRQTHAWDPAGDLSVRAGRRRSRRGGVSQRRYGREGGSGWIDGL